MRTHLERLVDSEPPRSRTGLLRRADRFTESRALLSTVFARRCVTAQRNQQIVGVCLSRSIGSKRSMTPSGTWWQTCLREVATRLRSCVRKAIRSPRLRGDEFALLLNQPRTPKN